MNFDIKDIIKTIKRKNQELADPQLIHPERDWQIGVVVALVIIFVAVGWSVFQYRAYTRLPLDAEAILPVVPYKPAIVEKALAEYKNRIELHNSIIASTGVDQATKEIINPNFAIDMEIDLEMDKKSKTNEVPTTKREAGTDTEAQTITETEITIPDLAI